MKHFSFAALFLTAVWFTTTVFGRVEGPFGLYTKSADPAWNLRFLSVVPRTGYLSIADKIASPSQIPSSSINFFLNTTSTISPDAPYGHLTWGAQSTSTGNYSNSYAIIGGTGLVMTDITSAVQPLYFEYEEVSVGYATHWNFTSNKKLQLDGNNSRFYTKHIINAPWYNSPAVHWRFGGLQSDNATAITIWRYDH